MPPFHRKIRNNVFYSNETLSLTLATLRIEKAALTAGVQSYISDIAHGPPLINLNSDLTALTDITEQLICQEKNGG